MVGYCTQCKHCWREKHGDSFECGFFGVLCRDIRKSRECLAFMASSSSGRIADSLSVGESSILSGATKSLMITCGRLVRQVAVNH